MAITLTVDGASPITNIPYTDSMNVQAALEAAYSLGYLSFWIEYYGTYNDQYLGYFVTHMDGTSQQGTNYWILYINNVLATEGIDETLLNDGDQIAFNYEPYSETVHGHTKWKFINEMKK